MTRKVVLTSLLMVSLGLACGEAHAGQATVTRQVISPAQFREGLDWYAAHRANILKAANAKIVQSLGRGQFVLETTSPLGPSQYLVQETSEIAPGKTIIRIKFLRKAGTGGTIADQSMTVTLTRHDEQTRVQLALFARIDHPFASDSQVKAVLDGSIAGTVKYLENPPNNP